MKPTTVNIWLKNSERIISYVDGEMLNAYNLVPYKVYNMAGEILDRGIESADSYGPDYIANGLIYDLGYAEEQTEWYLIKDYELEFLFK